MKTICFFIYDLRIGGAEKVVVYLANYFSEQNKEVIILTVADNNDFDLSHIINPKIKVMSLNKRRFRNVLPALIGFIKSEDIDCFISSVWPLTIISSFILLFSRKVKLVFLEHCALSQEFKDRSYLFKIFQNISISIFYKLPHHVVTVSEGVKEALIAMGVKRSKIETIYNPLPLLEEGELKKIEKSTEITKWINSKDKKIISVGQLKKEKNFCNLVKAISFFKKNYSYKLKVIILGDGTERASIESTIKKEGLEETIYLPGWVKDPIPFLKESDLFVLSSDFEGFGVVITEALSVGVNVVSTDCPSGPREILNNGEFGYLCETGSPEDLAKSIKKALDKPINKEKLISRSKDFSLEIIGMRYQELIENL
jgi:glycosyltransferase involved in cell wall biosynthesis